MIRTNLSTRPFYNDRAVRAWLVIAAALVVAATIFNVTRAFKYSRSDTQLAAQASRDEARSGDLRQQASRLRSTVDMRQIERASNEAKQANELIDRRTFSWTELFNRFETTLPDEVRIVTVRPHSETEQGIVIDVVVISRTVDDVNRFMENLDKSGAFADMRPIEEHLDEQTDLWQATFQARYAPSAQKPAGGAGATGP